MNSMPRVKRETVLPSDSKLELKRRNEDYDFLPRLCRAIFLFGFCSGNSELQGNEAFYLIKQEVINDQVMKLKPAWN
jgi:hypothetical protein